MEEPSHHMEMKHCVQEEGPWLVSLGEVQHWRDQLGKHQEDSLSQTVLTSERLFAQGGSYLSLSLLPPTLPTRTHFHKLNSQGKRLKQNSVFINHQKNWADLKSCEDHQSARAFCQSIYLNKIANVETGNKNLMIILSVVTLSTVVPPFVFLIEFFQQRMAMTVRMETALIIACL